MDWLYYFLGAFAPLAIASFLWSIGRDYLIESFLKAWVLICFITLVVLALKEPCEPLTTETPAKKNNNESSCMFQLEQKHLSGQLAVSRSYPVSNQLQFPMEKQQKNEWGAA